MHAPAGAAIDLGADNELPGLLEESAALQEQQAEIRAPGTGGEAWGASLATCGDWRVFWAAYACKKYVAPATVVRFIWAQRDEPGSAPRPKIRRRWWG